MSNSSVPKMGAGLFFALARERSIGRIIGIHLVAAVVRRISRIP